MSPTTTGSESVSRFRAVVAFSLGTLFFFYAFVQRVSPSVMTEELMRDFSVGGAALGILSATYFYTYALIQLPVGILIDRFGPRKLMSMTALVCAAASYWFSISDSLFIASISRALIGGSVAFAFVATLTVATLFFPAKRFALSTGLLLSVGMFGAIAGQAPLRVLLEQVGWRQTFVLLALVALFLSVLLFILVPRRPAQTTMSPNPVRNPFAGLQAVVTLPQSWWSAGAGYGLSATMLSFAGLWAVPWLTSTRGFANTEAASVASFLFLGWAAGAPVMGWVSDRIGRRKPVLITGSMLTLVSLLLLLYAGFSTFSTLAVLFLVNGFTASSMVVCFALVRECNNAENNATAMGLTNMCVVAAGAVMQPLIGWLLDLHWSGELQAGVRVYQASNYNFALASLVVAVALAIICSVMVRETYCRPLVQ